MLVSILGQLIWTDSLGDFYITKCIKIYLPLCKWWTTFSETMPFHPSRGSIGSSCVKWWFLFYMIGFANKISVCCLFGSFKVNKHNNIINKKNDKLASKNTERNWWSVSSLILFCEMASQTYSKLNFFKSFFLETIVGKNELY